jgi:phosphonate transport system substrate-binding protein
MGNLRFKCAPLGRWLPTTGIHAVPFQEIPMICPRPHLLSPADLPPCWPLAALAHAQQVFRVTAIPDESPTELARKAGAADQVPGRSKLGMKVEFTPVTDYAAAVEALVNKKVDLAWFGGFTFVQANMRSGGKVCRWCSAKKTPSSVGVHHQDRSGIKTLADLKGKDVSFGSQSSTSGHLMPRSFLLQAGLNPDKDFKRVAYSGAHDATIAAVAAARCRPGAEHLGVGRSSWPTTRSTPRPRCDVFFTTPPYYDYNWTVHADMPAACARS